MVTRAEEPTILAPKLPLSILLLEDNPDDAELCLRILRKAQLDLSFDVAKTREEFASRLKATGYDIVLADYNLGPWTGMDALHFLREKGYRSPVILVTGALGEQRAVECIKDGIADYILKDRLERLPIAILRAVEEEGLRAERERVERALRESEAKFRTLAEAIPAAIFIEEGTRCRYVNRAAENITGYAREELLSMYFWQLLLPKSRDAVLERTIKRFRGDESTRRYEIEILTKQKRVKSLDVTVGIFPIDGGLAALITAFETAGTTSVGNEVCEAPKAIRSRDNLRLT
jgi:PAS domain S-box-containing protein